MENKKISRLFKLMKYIPVIFILLILALTIKYYDKITIDNIISFTPDNTFLAILLILALFFIKSISVVMPTAVLYGACGKLFPLALALFINLLGLIIVLSFPYIIGRHYGKDLIDAIYIKYPKTKKIDQFKNSSEWFFVIVSRILKVVPGDIISMVLGGMNINFIIYLIFSLLVRIPPMVSNTLIGASIVSRNYTGAIISTGITFLISIVSTYIFIRKKHKKRVSRKIY